MKCILVAGAGGFIGGHLVKALLEQGHYVRAVDIKSLPEWYQLHLGARVDNQVWDLRRRADCLFAIDEVKEVYNLAASMGGMGYIETHKADCMLNSLINTHLLLAAKENKVKRYFFTSSACVYAAEKQRSFGPLALKEEDAYPAMPEDGYGWEKLFSERMCRHFTEDFGIITRVARLHNVYGPHGTYEGGREKAPAAICRKIIQAKHLKEPSISIWGDGNQTRSFTWIDDCIYGIRMIMNSSHAEPINLGSSEQVSINQLVDIVEEIAGIKVKRHYELNAPKGVNGRSSDNTLIKHEFDWEPSTKLRDGMEKTYRWIESQIV